MLFRLIITLLELLGGIVTIALVILNVVLRLTSNYYDARIMWLDRSTNAIDRSIRLWEKIESRAGNHAGNLRQHPFLWPTFNVIDLVDEFHKLAKTKGYAYAARKVVPQLEIELDLAEKLFKSVYQ